MGMDDRLTRFLLEGIVQAGLLYTPQLRPGLSVEKVLDDELVLVASWPNPTLDLGDAYVFVDWGPEFVHAHAAELPDLATHGLTLSLGAMAAEFVVRRRAAAYLPVRYIKRYLDAGQLHLVPDAPSFPYPVWSVWRDDLDPDIAAVGRRTLRIVADAADFDQSEVVKELQSISG